MRGGGGRKRRRRTTKQSGPPGGRAGAGGGEPPAVEQGGGASHLTRVAGQRGAAPGRTPKCMCFTKKVKNGKYGAFPFLLE